MKNYFSLSRIKLSEIFQDTYEFLKATYQQSDKLFSEASPFGQLLSVINRLFSMNLYYIEDSITELNILTASRPSSIAGLAQLAGHNSTRAQSSTGFLSILYNNKQLTTGSKIIIPNFVKLKSLINNLSYIGVFSQEELVININEANTRTYSFKVFQGEVKNQKFTGTGDALQSYECSVPEGEWIDNYFVNVYVNGKKFNKVDSLYDMSFQDSCCIVRTGITSGIDIIFGNGSFGYIPELGSEIYVEYLVTEGAFGNIDKTTDSYFNFEDVGYDENGNVIDLNTYFQIAMQTSILLGSFPESTDLTKQLAPMNSRSMVLAQTSNYEIFFKKMQLFSFIKIYTKYNIFDPYVDNMVYIFLIPDLKKRLTTNSSYFDLDLSLFKLTDFEKFNLYQLIEESGSKIFGTVPYFIDPIFEKFGINMYVKIWNNYKQEDVKSEIISKISEYFLKFNRTDYIPKSDIIAIVENINGVDSVFIDFFSEKIEEFFSLLLNKNDYWKITNTSKFEDLKLTEAETLKLEYFYAEDTSYYMNYENLDYDNRINNEFYNGPLWDEDLFETKNLYKISFKNLLNYKNCTLEETYNFLVSLNSIKEYINKKFDVFGNIILEENIYPIFRGGFCDRYGNEINDKVNTNSNRLQPVNIFFETVDVNNNTPMYVNKNSNIS